MGTTYKRNLCVAKQQTFTTHHIYGNIARYFKINLMFKFINGYCYMFYGQ